MKRYEDLTITDNFMFAKVFSNEDVAKDFLQTVLKIQIEKITVVSEATSQEDPFHKSVRFDVLVKEALSKEQGVSDAAAEQNDAKPTRYFDVEMQMENTGELPKRSRYYQSMCDLDALGNGMSYTKLREQYILFLCPTDIFGAGKAIYRFENREETNPSILMGDLTYKNFYIFKKYNEIDDESTREYMRYFATQKCESEKMKRIQDIVDKYRKDPITRKAYMTLEQELNIRYEKGRKEERQLAEAKELESARNLIGQGVSKEIVIQSMHLSEDQIKAL